MLSWVEHEKSSGPGCQINDWYINIILLRAVEKNIHLYESLVICTGTNACSFIVWDQGIFVSWFPCIESFCQQTETAMIRLQQMAILIKVFIQGINF